MRLPFKKAQFVPASQNRSFKVMVGHGRDSALKGREEKELWTSARLGSILPLILFLSMVFGGGNIFSEEPFSPASVVDQSAAQGDSLASQDFIASAIMSGTENISVNFKNADILEVIQVFAEKTGLNMVVGPDVKATVNIELNNMPWEQALNIILRNYNLISKKENKIIRVMTQEQVKQEDDKIPLETRVLTFNFSKADELKSSFSSMLTSRGRIEASTRTNSLIITDLPENLEKIEAIANSLDSRTPQVMIEALMADVKLTTEDQMGIRWKLFRDEDAESAFGKDGQLIAEQNLNLTGSYAGAITFGQTIFKATDLLATIKLWHEQQRVNILAHPLIMTLDNQPATIELIEQIPYTQQTTSTESSSAISTTAFKEAGIKLSVTPHITTKDNYISMNLSVEQSFRSGFTPDNQPIIDSRKADTNLLVKNGETIVIGGLRKKEDSVTLDKVPVLGDIPVLGALFRKSSKAVTDVDLLIFVTPRIVVEPQMTETERSRLEMFSPTLEDEKRFKMLDKKPKAKTKPVGAAVLPEENNFHLRPPS